jgi:AcrR family transcriptional regulator
VRHNPVMQAAPEIAESPATPAAGRRPRARRGEGDRLRTEIVEAASAMLAESGEVGELSLRSVARAVGVAATSIYRHFADLDALVMAVKIEFLRDFGAALDAAADAAGPDPYRRVRARAQAYYDYGLRNPGRYRVMFASPLVTGLQPGRFIGEEVVQRVQEDVQAAIGRRFLGEEAVQRVQEDVEAATGEPDRAAVTTVHLWTALHGTVTLRMIRPNFPWPDLDTQLDDLIDRLIQPHRPAG